MLRGLLAAGCCVLALPVAAARADFVDDNPAAAAHGGQLEVFLHGSDSTLVHSLRNPDASWTPWQALDGTISSGPGAVGVGNAADVFVRSGLATFHRVENGTSFGPWENLGGAALSAPTAFRERGNGVLVIYVRWADNTIVENYYSGTAWVGWQLVPGGGLTLSAPAAASRLDGYVDLVVRADDDSVAIQEWNGSQWLGWGSLGGSTQAAPSVVSRAPATLDVFARGGDGQVHWRQFNGATWLPWITLPGSVDSGPGATVDESGRIYLFARKDGDVAMNTFAGAWSGWQPLHPAPAPPPGCSPSAGIVTAKTHTVGFGRRPRVTGRLRNPAGGQLVGLPVLATNLKGSRQGAGGTSKTGRFSVRLRRGHNRTVVMQVPLPNAHALACSGPVAIRVRAGVTLAASRTVRPGGRVHFHGRLLGGPIPAHGKLVELQAFDGGRWRTFATPRAHGRGRFHSTYHLQHTFGPRTFRFRARVRREAAYPYVLGYSKSIYVRVR
jgi:hypothetical protein